MSKSMRLFVVVAALAAVALPAAAVLCPFNRDYMCNTECDWDRFMCFDERQGVVCFDAQYTCGENTTEYEAFCRCRRRAAGGF